jgi:hypothetical protein
MKYRLWMTENTKTPALTNKQQYHPHNANNVNSILFSQFI